MHEPLLRASFDVLPGELVVDSFAGGGGASTGIEAALGRPVDIAINHDAVAIAMHKQNHPETKHYTTDVWEVDPRTACGARPVGLFWLSPACVHFSRAKGTTNPLSAKIRSLAWVAVKPMRDVRPRVVLLENVEEFESWGPLDASGRPDPTKLGRTFRQWVGRMRGLGYHVEHRTLVAADYGAPTTRKRLFVIARCDGKPIIWPEATHGPCRVNPWRPASEVIDWSLPCPSIFDRPRPLKEATLRRIAAGIQRYVINSAEPFVIPVTHHGDSRAHGVSEPLRTITAAHRGELAVVNPYIVRHGHYSTITGAGLVEGAGAGTFRGQALDTPLATVCATNDKHLAAAFLSKFYGTSTGSPMQAPLPTVTSGGGRGGGHLAEVRAFLVSYYSQGGRAGSSRQLGLPLGTVTTRDRFGLVMVHGEPYQDIGMRMLQPHELFAAQGFPEHYEIDECDGRRLTKTEQTRLAGNSVCPPIAAALVAANTRGEAARAA